MRDLTEAPASLTTPMSLWDLVWGQGLASSLSWFWSGHGGQLISPVKLTYMIPVPCILICTATGECF